MDHYQHISLAVFNTNAGKQSCSVVGNDTEQGNDIGSVLVENRFFNVTNSIRLIQTINEEIRHHFF